MNENQNQSVNPRLVDHAAVVLEQWRGQLAPETLARLWDDFHAAKDSHALAQRFVGFASAPKQLLSTLVSLKRITDPGNEPLSEPVSAVVRAILRLKTIDRRALEIAERNPQILKALIDVATKNPD